LDIFTTEVLPASKKAIPDRQTQQLAQVIRKMTGTHGKAEGVKILDLGAGLGRIAKELSKLSIWQLANSIQWVCWEPNAKLRCDLEMILRNEQISAKIIQSYDELPKSGCHIALLANVLHEVTPEEFASLIMSAFRAISGVDNSKIIILEIYPLLRAEKYAIAYPCSYLTRLLNGIGFYCRSDTFSINDAQGYCIEAKPSCNNLNENIIQYNLLQIWEDLEKEICSSYACQEEINSYVEYRRMILELTTLASIAAWRKGIWKRLA